MDINAKHLRVSEILAFDVMELERRRKLSGHAPPQLERFMAEVRSAMRDVEFAQLSVTSAHVYRKGDTHVLGEIGYRDVGIRCRMDPVYFVRSRRIQNARYSDGAWHYHVKTSKALTTAVSAAATYLVPYSCEEAVNSTKGLARDHIQKLTEAAYAEARNSYRELTGEAGYSNNMSGPLMRELRGHVFASDAMNAAAAKFYTSFDEYTKAQEAAKRPMVYLGFVDNYGQLVVDMATAEMTYPFAVHGYTRIPADSAPDWIKGKVAVLNMLPAAQFLPQVGLRLDDRIFFVTQEDGNLV